MVGQKRALIAARHAMGLYSRYRQTGDLGLLHESIGVFASALSAKPRDLSLRATILSGLGRALRARYERTGDLADVDAAIDAVRSAVAATTHDDPYYAGRLSNLGNALRTRFERTRNPADIDNAVAAGRDALAATPYGRSDRALTLSHLASALMVRSQWSGDLADATAAIDTARDAVAASSHDDPNYAVFLSGIGNALSARFGRTGDLADIDAAIDAARDAVATTPNDHLSRAKYLSNFAHALSARYGRTGDLADVDAAIDAARDAVATTPNDHPHRGTYLSNLRIALQARYQRAGNVADLESAMEAGHDAGQRAIDLLKHEVDIAPPASTGLQIALTDYGDALEARYDRYNDRADLEAAISSYQRCLKEISADVLDAGLVYFKLGNLLNDKAKYEPALLDEVVAKHQLAIRYTEEPSPLLARRLSALGTGLRHRYDERQDPDDLLASLTAHRRAVQVVRADTLEQSECRLNLANALRAVYDRFGDEARLEACILEHRKVLDSSPPPGLRALSLLGLGNALMGRFARHGDFDDPEKAFLLFQEASTVESTSPVVRAGILNSLAAAAAELFEQDHDTDWLTVAIEPLADAVRLVPTDIALRHGLFSQLGSLRFLRFLADNSPDDYNQASQDLQLAAQTDSPGPRIRALSDFGQLQHARYRAEGNDPAVLASAIDALSEAHDLAPAGTGARLDVSVPLAHALRDRHALLRSHQDLVMSVTGYRDSANQALATHPALAITVARAWGQWAMDRRAWKEAVEATGYGLEAMIELVRIQTRRKAKETWLDEAQELPVFASFARAKAGDAAAAVLALETGRAVLLAEALDSGPFAVDDLVAHGHADLAAKYSAAAGRWNQLTLREVSKIDLSHHAIWSRSKIGSGR